MSCLSCFILVLKTYSLLQLRFLKAKNSVVSVKDILVPGSDLVVAVKDIAALIPLSGIIIPLSGIRAACDHFKFSLVSLTTSCLTSKYGRMEI